MNFFIPTASMGNGISLATIGRAGEIMGFFYPHLDHAQNVREGMPGLRLLDGSHNGRFIWCFEADWQIQQAFEPASNILVTRWKHQWMDLTIELTDLLPPRTPAMLRKIVIQRGPDVPPVQFMHYFRLAVGDVEWQNGIQFHPEHNAVVQYHRETIIAVSANRPLLGQCSTIRPGQDSPTKHAMIGGHLGHSFQSIGRVDFAVAFEPADTARWEAVMVLAGGDNIQRAIALAAKLAAAEFDDSLRQTNERVAAELANAGNTSRPELAEAFDRAVISLHDLFDDSFGAFIAAPEFDSAYQLSGGYGYVWPRDAAVCALAAARIGHPQIAQRFFDWAASTQLPNGHWFQRYWTDGSAAPSWCVRPDQIQLDQTCAILHAAGQYARLNPGGNKKFIEHYRPVIQRATQAVLNHLQDDGMHKPATDLWENTVGQFPYTQASVIAALKEADEVFCLWPERTGLAPRRVLQERLFERFWQQDRERWLRCITADGAPDPMLDSSVMGLIDPWNVFDLSDPEQRQWAINTLTGISRDLRSEVKGGSAILRFAGESYMGGGPGCVNTLWLALCWLRLAATAAHPEERREQISRALVEVRIALANTSPTGQLPELIPKINFNYWAAPHGWASALLIEIVLALRELDSENLPCFDAERARVRRQAPTR